MESPKEHISARKFAYIALSIGILCIGFSAILVRWANAPGIVTSFYRMAIGATLMALPFLIKVRKPSSSLPSRGILFAIIGGFFFAMDLSLWTTGIKMSGATIPTLMSNTAPLFVGLGSLLIFRESQKPQFWGGLILAMIGAAVVLGMDLSQSPKMGLGTILSIGAAIFYAAYILITQRGRKYLDTLPYFWLSTFSSSIFLWIVSTLFRYPLSGYTTQTWIAFLLTGIFVQVVGWLAINYAQGYLPAALVSPTLLGQPVVTAIFASIFLGETFTFGYLIGGLMVLAGVYLVHRSK